ncbi:MAG: hypothetical protein K6G54_01430 [Oscillospiraceae bacterium]|nr:hypothetical protein [Oscillospiraceae bacterium]
MKVLSRDFTLKEKVLLLILVLLLFGLGYYYFIDQPVRKEIARCEVEKANLQIELDQINIKLNTLETMREELETIEASGDTSEMKSYNASKEEIKLLNDVLSFTTQYSITFANVTRDGDQIRRNFSLQFSADDFQTLSTILEELSSSPMRCRVSDVQCSRRSRYLYYGTEYNNDAYSVSATATFYETMVGGTPDAGLPPEK